MNTTQRSEISSFSEEYLQISPNILSSFPRFRPPVSLYYFKPETNMVQLYAKQEERVSKARQQEVAALCEDGLLFLSREDYKIYAQHICKKLGLILVETSLDERDIAEILYQALKMRLNEFFDQPTEPVWKELFKNITIFSEYLWIDPCRATYLARNLHTEDDLAGHGVNACFVGIALYTFMHKSNGNGLDKLQFNNVTAALLLHDLGMSKVPPYITGKPTPLRKQEQQSVQLHPGVGHNIISRLNIQTREIIQAMLEHHERLDGSGYPNRIKGQEISPIGRLTAVADAYCAMIATRPFRDPFPVVGAAKKLLADAKRFDPDMLKGLFQVMAKGIPGCNDKSGTEARTDMKRRT